MKIGAFRENGGKVPAEVGLLLAAYLQLGWHVNAANFDLFRRLSQLKFLPFVITPTGLRYYMYRPSAETMQKAIARFEEVLVRLDHLVRNEELDLLLEHGYAAVLVSRASDVLGSRVGDCGQAARVAYSRLSTAVYSMAAVDERPIGFVYRDLMPGPHNARRFTADMFIEKR